MIGSARWRKCPRKNGATFFILVQIQAGPPAFAAAQLRLGKPAYNSASNSQFAFGKLQPLTIAQRGFDDGVEQTRKARVEILAA